MEWGHEVNENRIGLCGAYAEVGDIVEVVKGRKFPIGMKMVVTNRACFNYNGYPGYRDDYKIEFYDEGFKKQYISEYNVKIIAQHESKKDNPEYVNVHRVEVYV